MKGEGEGAKKSEHYEKLVEYYLSKQDSSWADIVMKPIYLKEKKSSLLFCPSIPFFSFGWEA